MPTSNNEYIIVIRTVNERTLQLCQHLIVKQSHNITIHVIKNLPLEETIKVCYEIGSKSKKKWMITVDADVLISEGALNKILAESEKLPKHYLQVEGRIVDKLTQRVRWAGIRCYRTELLAKAIELIPSHSTIRPESSAIDKMKVLGHPSKRSNSIFGLHDFEQFYSDIYRKAFIHSYKHQMFLFDMINTWKQKAKYDTDFIVALKGVSDGLCSLSLQNSNKNTDLLLMEQILTNLNVTEKEVLNITHFDITQIDSDISSMLNSNHFKEIKNEESRTQRAVNNFRTFGPILYVPYFFGSFLFDLGRKIKKLVKTLNERSFFYPPDGD